MSATGENAVTGTEDVVENVQDTDFVPPSTDAPTAQKTVDAPTPQGATAEDGIPVEDDDDEEGEEHDDDESGEDEEDDDEEFDEDDDEDDDLTPEERKKLLEEFYSGNPDELDADDDEFDEDEEDAPAAAGVKRAAGELDEKEDGPDAKKAKAD